MKIIFLIAFIATLALSILTPGILLDIVGVASYSSSGTTVGGIVWENTTWTLENSPYIITDTVQIPENVTLTIELGVLVSRPTAGDMFLVHGRIEAHGTAYSKIIFDGGGNSNFFNAKSSGVDARVDLDYCIIKNGYSLWPATGFEACGSFNLRHSLLMDLTSYSYFWGQRTAGEKDFYIEYNTFYNTAGFSGGLRVVYIRNNLFVRNRDVIVENQAGPAPIVKHNSFMGMKGIVLKLPPGYGSASIVATENYWGTNDTKDIDSMIYDKKDDITCAGFIEYLPILNETHPDTPTLPLIVDFTCSPSTLYARGWITFDASASFGLYSTVASYTWGFGDGNITTLNRPIVTHTYTTPGNYNVTLTIADEFGFQNSTTKNFTVFQDIFPPSTSNNYDGVWHTSDFTITLSAIDNESGVAEIYYRINDGAVKAVTTDGQPPITFENSNTTLEYWSVDNVGNEELPHKILTGIKLDKTVSSGSIIINNGDAYTTSTSVILNLAAADATSGVYQVRYSNDGIWDTEPWEIPSPSKTWELTLGDGTKTVYYQIRDNAGLISQSYQDTITLDATKPTANAGQDRTVNMGATVTFDASASTDNVGIVSYEWDFGDGTTGTGNATTHTYTSPRTYTVMLTVRDAAGNAATHQITVTVPPSEAFPLWILGVAVAVIGAATVATILWRRQK